MIPVVDLFAGPGGLSEGFSSIVDKNNKRIFETVASFEMNSFACQTLKLRATFRELKSRQLDLTPYFSYISGRSTWEETYQGEFRLVYDEASGHVHEIELGEPTREEVDAKIRRSLKNVAKHEPWVLIGGPPCQAYSLAGRSRRTGDVNFENDHKHFLYKEYLRIIERFKPSIFVMENVKGLLSSTNRGQKMFAKILEDLRDVSSGDDYEIRSLVVDSDPKDIRPEDFVIRAERYGIPQKRHRVILLGVRRDISEKMPRRILEEVRKTVTVRDAIGSLPSKTSAKSNRKPQKDHDWEAELANAVKLASGSAPAPVSSNTSRSLGQRQLQSWLEDNKLASPVQHEPRSHMISDLVRYRHLAIRAEEIGHSPKYSDLAAFLQPDHKNIGKEDTPFLDRFRVQVWDQPSTTVVSHISKDGHYYIHPDPRQGRSLTVREAARLQTFPDNYFFEGPRTQQFHQVGNAVPPLLAKKIADQVLLMINDAFMK